MKLGNEFQDLDKKANNMEEKFSKEMEIVKNNQVEMSEMKTSVNQVKTTVDSISRHPCTGGISNSK
jgi:hypothetical protein